MKTFIRKYLTFDIKSLVWKLWCLTVGNPGDHGQHGWDRWDAQASYFHKFLNINLKRHS